MTGLARLSVALPVLGVLLGLAASAIAVVPVGASTAPGPGLTSSLLAPVYVHFSPNIVSAPAGTSVALTVVVADAGPYHFTATTCSLWYRSGSSGPWSNVRSCLNTQLFPHTFGAHSKSTLNGSQPIPSNVAPGMYEWKIQFGGIYRWSAHTHTGILMIRIT